MTIAQAHQFGLRHATHRWKAESKPGHLVFIVCANFEPRRNDLVRSELRMNDQVELVWWVLAVGKTTYSISNLFNLEGRPK